MQLFKLLLQSILLRLILKTIMQLNQIKDKGHYKVIKMDESQRCMSRLMDMGLLPGELICIRHEAPLGDPISIEFKDCHVSIRLKDAAFLEVDIINESTQ